MSMCVALVRLVRAFEDLWADLYKRRALLAHCMRVGHLWPDVSTHMGLMGAVRMLEALWAIVEALWSILIIISTCIT